MPEAWANSSNSLTDKSSSQSVPLSHVSEKDKPWDVHKKNAELAASYYAQTDGFKSQAQSINHCAELLNFGGEISLDTGEIKLILKGARFCRIRTCPTCQWRRSLRWKAKAHQLIPKVMEKFPGHRWLFVTHTIKNCPVEELSKTLNHMKESYKRMLRCNAWPAVGYVRSVEVTRNKVTGEAHPHFHSLLLVPNSYLTGRSYLQHSEWQELWRKSARLDYPPSVDVRAIKKGKDYLRVIPEIFKYQTKESDLLSDRDFFIEYTCQMHGTRSISTGGVLRTILKELTEEPEDLIGKDSEEDALIDEQFDIYFGWKGQRQRYEQVYR